MIDERAHAELAAEPRCSEAVVRQRVSRGLRRLRSVVEEIVTRDPYYDLERQLRDAVRDRRCRRRVSRRSLLAIAAALVLGGGLAVSRALFAGDTAAQRTAACARDRREPPLRVVAGRQSAGVLRRLGVCHRGRSRAAVAAAPGRWIAGPRRQRASGAHRQRHALPCSKSSSETSR